MKLLLDVSGVTRPLSGIGRYAVELARRLPGSPGVEAVAFLRGGAVTADFDPEAVAAPADAAALRSRLRPLLPYRLVLGPWRRRRARALARRLEPWREYIYHSPNFSMPPLQSPAVVTLHDLSVFHFPQFHPRDRVNYLREQIHHSVARADRLVCDSAFVRDEVLSLFGVAGERVTAIPLGVDPAYRPREAAQLGDLAGRYGLVPGSYLLSVGTLEPRKNLAGLLAAYRRLPAALRRRHPLVIAGAYGWGCEGLLADIRRMQAAGELVYLDYVPEPLLPQLYAGAIAFCYFSYYEGFGLPVLEAMGSGVPVLCADSSALPELCAPSALRVDPGSQQAMADALARALEDADWRATARIQGLERAAHYTWERTCAALVALFGELAA